VPNNTLQVTFDPLPTFAVAKAGSASNAPERGRQEDFGSAYYPRVWAPRNIIYRENSLSG